QLNQEIALYLRNDRDLVHFRAVCHDTKDAIDSEDSFWFKRFHIKYDPTVSIGKGSTAYKETLRKLYQTRAFYSRTLVEFKQGHTNLEKGCLKMIIGMIVDSFQGIPFVLRRDYNHQLYSRNLRRLRHYSNKIYSNLLDEVLFQAFGAENTNPMLHAVQVTFTAWCLRKSFGYGNFSFESSQRAAYASPFKEPIFHGFNKQTVNMKWILHVMNFFKYHITEEDNATLSQPFWDLGNEQYPTLWQGPLQNGPSKPGRYWKGTYAYIEREEVTLLRNNGRPSANDNKVFVDHNVDHGDEAIQTMSLDFPNNFPFKWPQTFETHLKSLEQPQFARTRAQHSQSPPFQSSRYRFQANGWDNENFSGSGWLQTLPTQFGIPGWKRMTMMKYFENEHETWDEYALWAYEGVVLPGDQIIIGRWWSPEEDTPTDQLYTGPFIFWNVDASIPGTDLHTKLAEAPMCMAAKYLG
ncbi:hypothetical protein K490DRAFT_38547, partial [Saccharata proteae CBS 121410]